MRYCYKSKDGKSYVNYKEPISDDSFIAITEEEFNQKIEEIKNRKCVKKDSSVDLSKYTQEEIEAIKKLIL